MRAFFLIAFLLFTACVPAPEAPDISIENAYVKLPLPGQTTAVGYFDIVNKGGADVLVSISSPVSDKIELHDHVHEDGMMKMTRVENVPVSAHETTQFKSGGLHVMMFEASEADVPMLTFRFKTSGEIEVLGSYAKPNN